MPVGTALDGVAQLWRSYIRQVLADESETPVLLSGGMDSAAIVAAMLSLGFRPRCFAYRLGSAESEDLLAARRICEDHDLELEEVHVPADGEALARDVRRTIQLAGSARKTVVQCCHVLLYLVPALREAGYARAITGTGGICEDNRKAKILMAESSPVADVAELARVRRANLLHGDPGSATESMKRFAADLGVTLFEPYSAQPLADYGLSIPLREMNRPHQKGVALRAFPEFFVRSEHAAPRYWRANSSLQVNGGVRALHDTLLSSSLNRRGSLSVAGIYNDILADLEAPRLDV